MTVVTSCGQVHIPPDANLCLGVCMARHRGSERPECVLSAVERRLWDSGAVVELRQFHGLSAQEMDVLIYREVHA